MRVHEMQVEIVDLDKIEQHPDNANNGDVDALEESIDVNGFFAPLLVQRSTGRIIAGNHRYLVAMRRGLKNLPVIYLDIDDVAALRIMLADNAVTRKGHDDEGQLLNLMHTLYATDIGLRGTGYVSEQMVRLDQLMNEPLDFDANDATDNRDPEPPRMRWSIYPVPNEDGDVLELTLIKEGMGPITKTDANGLRRALGMPVFSKEDLEAFGVDKWR